MSQKVGKKLKKITIFQTKINSEIKKD